MKKNTKVSIDKLEKRMNQMEIISGDVFGEIFDISIKKNTLNTDVRDCVKDIVACIEYGKANKESFISKVNYFDVFTICMIKNFTDVYYDSAKGIEGILIDVMRSIRCMDNAMIGDKTMLSVIVEYFMNRGHYKSVNEMIKEESKLSTVILKTLSGDDNETTA